MKVVKIMGGLGNQMFQYAFYRVLQLTSDDVRADLSYYNRHQSHNGYELERVFGIRVRTATLSEIRRLRDDTGTLVNRMKVKLFGRRPTHRVDGEEDLALRVRDSQDCYYEGYWQKLRYVEAVEGILREDFVFHRELDSTNSQLVEEIRASNSVGVHVRRGDYVTNKHAARLHGDICDVGYYRRAIEAIADRVEHPRFYIFSDDCDWVTRNMPIADSIVVDWNTGQNSYIDMQLMSYCNHNVIANSTFSWWSAWLNQNEGKVVISPSRWIHGRSIDSMELIPSSWTCI